MPRTPMDAGDIQAFLDERRTGVLSLADGDEGYGVPVSFAYEADKGELYFRLGYASDSQKRRFVDATRYATFVVYDHTDAGWASVVAEGPLTVVSDNTVDASLAEATNDLDIQYVDIHAAGPADLEFNLARLDVETLDGIVEDGS